MATDSARWVPSSSSTNGKPPAGFFASISGVRFLRAKMSTCSVGILSPFSATKILSLRGLGARASSYIFMMVAI